MIKNIGFAVTGSFCTQDRILLEIKKLVDKGYKVLPVVTPAVEHLDTRFGEADTFLKALEEASGNSVIMSLVDAEPVGPNNLIDVLVIAPCTGNTLAKLANAITDNAVLMMAKSHLRNNKPVVVGISTNDALGGNMYNLAKLINEKNIFFIPFGQDEPFKKPKSLISDFSLIEETIIKADLGEQLQPILLK